MRNMIAFTLRSTGHEIVGAQDGVAALDVLKSRRVDLVITDINMPRMDGIELTRRIRAIPSYRGVPVILLTTESHAEIKNQGRAAGATGWIVKPFQPDQLLAVVARVLPAQAPARL
jgi:two-component system chemotaxis response regulator CheY